MLRGFVRCVRGVSGQLRSPEPLRSDARRSTALWRADCAPTLSAALFVRGLEEAFAVQDATGQSPAYVYFRNDKNKQRQARVLTRDEARRIAANVARLAEVLTQRQKPID